MEYLPLEKAMINCLKKILSEDKVNKFKSQYFFVKEKLYDEILPTIANVEPTLTDHSGDHIDNVLNNVYKLIHREIEKLIESSPSSVPQNTTILTYLDMYFLCQTSLFHDVGNIYGRENHNQNIQTVIKENFNDVIDDRQRSIIVRAGRAHTGKNLEGSKDTLKSLVDDKDQYDGSIIHLRSVAAIIRFADELAEGPQRTSNFMLNHDKLGDSTKYHEYASMTQITIDTDNSRIVVAYQINVDTSKYTTRNDIAEYLENTFRFIYSRIIKLDEERKYYNFYCNLASNIKEIQVSFEIEKDKIMFEVINVEELILNDLVIPGEDNNDYPFVKQRPDLDLEKLIPNICKSIIDEG